MYGEKFTEPGGAGLQAGVNEVNLTFVGINRYENAKGSGPVLDFVFTSKKNPSREFRHRLFPVDESTLKSRYQDYVTNATKRGSVVSAYEEFRAKQYNDFNGEVKLLITQYMAASKFDEHRKAWLAKLQEKGKSPTFENFVSFITTALVRESPNYKDITGYLLLGYRPNSKYLSAPRFNSDTALYFATDPDIKLELWESSKMSFTKPEVAGGFNISADEMPVTGAPTSTNTATTEANSASSANSDDDDDLPF